MGSLLDDLILVPTMLELNKLGNSLDDLRGRRGCQVAICGFGAVAAAARTAALVERHSPRRVWLIGIAGALQQRGGPLGSANVFSEVLADGIGVGSGSDFLSAGEMGWPHFQDDSMVIGDRLKLAEHPNAVGSLLTVTAASANADHAAFRRQQYPDAIAEDMEGFAVALACQLAGIRATVIRGISNFAGDRETRRWSVEPALSAAADLLNNLMERSSRDS